MMEFKIAMKEMKDVVKKIDKSVMKKASFPILEIFAYYLFLPRLHPRTFQAVTPAFYIFIIN